MKSSVTPPRLLILNRFAKSSRASRLEDLVRKTAGDCRIEITEHPGDAAARAAAAVRDGCTAIVAAGGDGTINEVLQGVAGSGAALGIIPIGSVNVLARQLRIPLSIPAAWRLIERGTTRCVDLGKIEFNENGEARMRYFVQMAGVGLDAHIIRCVTWRQKQRWGPLSYVFASFRCAQEAVWRVAVRLDDGAPVEGAFVLIGNGAFYGGPFRVFNRASMTDGKLDVCVFKSTAWRDLLRYLVAIARGRQTETPGIAYHQATRVEIGSEFEVPLQVDGEFAGFLPAKVSIIPNGLTIFAPPLPVP